MQTESFEEKITNQSCFHLAGIIPVDGQPLDFNFPWHDSMIPISADFLAIERAILECATVGCETIWLVCPSDMQPLLRHRIGDAVQDPVWINRKFDVFPSMSRKEIPIYYVESHPKHQGKRESLSWSILYGAKVAKKITQSMSNWLTPDKYYVCFPYSVYPSQYLKRYREDIRREGNFFLLTDMGESVLDNKFIGFAFEANELGNLTSYFWRKQTGKFDPSQPVDERKDGKFITKLLPKDERYSGRFFTLQDIFTQLDLKKDTYKLEIDWYYDISNWENLCIYLGSEEQKKMSKPKLKFFTKRKWNKIGEDDE